MPSRSTSESQPQNWPAQIPYLRNPDYSPTLTPSNFEDLKSSLPGLSLEASSAASSSKPSLLLSSASKSPSPLIRITPITDPKHPAFGQSGLYATRDLAPGAFILEYLGTIHCSRPDALSNSAASTSLQNKHADSDYDLSLDRFSGLGIDAACKGNEARFINDYRGVSRAPNAEFREIWVSGRNVGGVRKFSRAENEVLGVARGGSLRGEKGMGVFVLGAGKGKAGKEGKKSRTKGIKKGEEILISYGRAFWGARQRVETDGNEKTCEAGCLSKTS